MLESAQTGLDKWIFRLASILQLSIRIRRNSTSAIETISIGPDKKISNCFNFTHYLCLAWKPDLDETQLQTFTSDFICKLPEKLKYKLTLVSHFTTENQLKPLNLKWVDFSFRAIFLLALKRKFAIDFRYFISFSPMKKLGNLFLGDLGKRQI